LRLAPTRAATSGGLRGYCRFDAERVAAVSHGFVRPGAHTLLGQGVFIMTVDQGPKMDRYQGVAPIEGETLALCAEQYFARSEQVPTRVRLAVGRTPLGTWRAGGVILQHIAEDMARGDTEEAWEREQALFETLGEDELVDPALSGCSSACSTRTGCACSPPSSCAPSAAARRTGLWACCAASPPTSGWTWWRTTA
jgi:redox-regulated HSP33 family molecular chaperone